MVPMTQDSSPLFFSPILLSRRPREVLSSCFNIHNTTDQLAGLFPYHHFDQSRRNNPSRVLQPKRAFNSDARLTVLMMTWALWVTYLV